jgi:hypothetical protein
MKTEIVIKQGKAKIVLYPESEFEEDLIEKVVDSRKGYATNTSISTDTRHSIHYNHKIEIKLIENKK